ncbi:MAG: YceI family protein [Schleiferiaceae bacterium]|jgi:polyisoprenoid-binding protein YceI|nr:YceI family protein [Schleiferiaceae bacterium]
MKRILSLALFLSFSFQAAAQFKINQETSNMYIDGTSSLHDWTETVETINGSFNGTTEGNTLKAINSLSITIPVESIKSGKSGMDKNTYKALKSDKHPNIKFILKSQRIEGNNTYLKGNLTVAGTTKPVEVKAVYKLHGSELKLEGKYDMKMTSFNVEPPTALMGTIKTGDEITIRFNLVLNK